MKKHIALFVTVALSLTTLTAIFLTACTASSVEKYYDKISDYRYVLLRLTDERFTLDVIGGVRETPYALDGTCAEGKTEYTVFTLRPTGDYAGGKETVPLSVTVGDTAYDLMLARHPFKNSYSSEIAAALPADTLSLAVSLGGETFEVPVCLSERIDGETALTVALDAVAERKKSWDDFEIYLRLSENTVTAAGGWYWYVAFLHGEDFDSVLINAVSGEIAAIRN